MQGGIGLAKEDLLKFLDFAAEKGLIKKKTVDNRKKACRMILGVLDDTEAADLPRIDLEGVMLRHRNLATSTIPPSSLRGYESHVRGSVRDFLGYVKDQASWKPGVRQRSSKAGVVAVSAKKSKAERPVSKSEGLANQEVTSRQPSIHIDFQIHISPDATPEQIDKIFESMSRHFGERTD